MTGEPCEARRVLQAKTSVTTSNSRLQGCTPLQVRGPGAPCSTAAECARVSTGLMTDLYEVRWIPKPPLVGALPTTQLSSYVSRCASSLDRQPYC